MNDYKHDDRQQRGWWAPGKYVNKCVLCSCQFIGDKRAGWCADCAYAEGTIPAHPATVTLRCPVCEKTKLAIPEPDYPQGTVEVQCLCPDCGVPVTFRFIDKDGNVL